MKHILYDTGYSGGKLRNFEEPKKGEICACGTQRQNSHVWNYGLKTGWSGNHNSTSHHNQIKLAKIN